MDISRHLLCSVHGLIFTVVIARKDANVPPVGDFLFTVFIPQENSLFLKLNTLKQGVVVFIHHLFRNLSY